MTRLITSVSCPFVVSHRILAAEFSTVCYLDRTMREPALFFCDRYIVSLALQMMANCETKSMPNFFFVSSILNAIFAGSMVAV